MLFALDNNKTKISPSPKSAGNCIVCGEVMIAKCGEKMVWHWAHKAGSNNCDQWYEPITDWHMGWMSKFPEESREVTITKEDYKEKHVIDIVTRDGKKIDLQSTRINVKEFEKRDKFWEDAIWIINAEEFYTDGLTFLNNSKKTKDVVEIVEGWNYPEQILQQIIKDVLNLDERIFLSSYLYSYNKESRLIFELKVDDNATINELKNKIEEVNAKYIFKCQKRKTPWLYHTSITQENFGMQVLDKKNNIAGNEFNGYNIYFDNVKGLENSLFDLKNYTVINKDEFLIKFIF